MFSVLANHWYAAVRFIFLRFQIASKATCASILAALSSLFAGLLLDTWSDAYGGTGKVFDWSLIPEEIVHQAVLSGGLNVQNVTDAVRSLRPHAVDVSSGIESSKGIKDAALMQAFVNAVRAGDTH